MKETAKKTEAKKEPDPPPREEREEPEPVGVWACDEHGETTLEPLTPHGFVDWFERAMAKTTNPTALVENNADAIEDIKATASALLGTRIDAATAFAARRLAAPETNTARHDGNQPAPEESYPSGPRSTDAAKLTATLLDDIATISDAKSLTEWRATRQIVTELNFLRTIAGSGASSFVRVLRVYDERLKKLEGKK